MLLHLLLPVLCVIKITKNVYVVNCNNLRIIMYNFGELFQAFEGPDMYMLIGVLCGLAIYNSTIIAINFPLALYKKLLKRWGYVEEQFGVFILSSITILYTFLCSLTMNCL